MHKSNVTCHAKRDGVALYYDNGRRVFLRAEEVLNIEVPEHFEKDQFTAIQNYHYKLAVYGLSSVKPEDLKKMSKNQLKYARTLFIKAQRELNRMKNERLDIIFEKMMPRLFHKQGQSLSSLQKSPIARTLMTDCSDEYDNVKNTLNFDTLGISKEMIVRRLVNAKILKPGLFNF